MSFTGSLINYDNNNDIFNKKRRSSTKIPLLNNFHNSAAQQANSANTTPIKNSMGKLNTSSLNSSITNSILTNANSTFNNLSTTTTTTQTNNGQQPLATTAKYMNSKRKYNKYGNMHTGSGQYHHHRHDHNNYLHLNSLWSIWYGVLLTLFQGYLAVHGAYRFLGCSLIPWKIEPVAELNLQIVLCGVVFILLPIFFTSAVFKVGNLANDGIKLATGAKERRCSLSPHDGLEEESSGGTLRALWTHGGPTAAFVHIVIAMCLLLPRLLLEARIIENGLLPKENIWHTELDFIAVNRQNLMVLSVVKSPYQNNSNSLEDEEDYYNDTMFTAIDSGAGGGGSGGSVTNSIRSNSNKFDNSNSNNNNKYGKKIDIGKSRFLEIPDLINQNNEASNGNKQQDNDDVDADVDADANANGSFEQGNRAVAGITGHNSEEQHSPERFDSNEFVGIKSINMPVTTTQSTTTAAVTQPTRAANGRRVHNGNYDAAWQTFGTFAKDNGSKDIKQKAAAAAATTTTSSTSTTGTTTTTTTTMSTTAKGQLASSTIAATKTMPTKAKTTQPTTTTSTSSGSFSSSSSSSSASTSDTPTTTTRAHEHQRQHHHNGKTLRKHNSHRQRQRAHNHRRHHGTNGQPARTLEFNQLDFEDDALELPTPVRKMTGGEQLSTLATAKSTSTVSTTTRDSNIHIVKPELLPEIIPSTPVSSNSKIIEIKTKSKKVKRMANDELQVEIEPEYLIGDLQLNGSNESSEYIASIESGSAVATNNLAAAVIPTAYNANSNTNNDNNNNNNNGLVQLDGFAGMLQIFFGIDRPIDVNVFAHPPSAEFVNLLFALLVWCVRYPAVFWSTTKSFATVFSVQMIAAAFDIIFSYVGASNLYKLQVYSEAIPVQNSGLILNGIVTLALFLLSTILIIASSMIMYLYGHGRLAAKMRDRSLITLKSNETWIYFAHCASLCYVLALAVVKAPLLNDLSVTYRSNLHTPTFLSALISVVHLLLWIVIWLILTAKRRWTFKLPPADGYGIHKATTQPLLMPNRSSIPSSTGLSDSTVSGVNSGSGGGGTGSDHKALHSLGSSIDGSDTAGHGNGNGSAGMGVGLKSGKPNNDDIYWPKLTPSSPKLKVTFNEVTSTSDDVLLIGDHDNQTDGKRNSPRGTTVCFTSITGEIDDGEYATLRAATAATVVGITVGPGAGGANASGHTPTLTSAQTATTITTANGLKILHLSEYDELPPPPPPQLMDQHGAASNQNNDANLNSDYANYMGIGMSCTTGDENISEEGKLLACVRDDSVTYASTRDLEPPQPPPPPPPASVMSSDTHAIAALGNCSVRAPQAMPEIMQLSSSPEHLVSPLAPVTVTVHTNEAHIASSAQSRCLRRGDSGVPNEALTPRSDTTSTTESTMSPPDRAPSESSSGVHSGEERDVEVVIRPRAVCKPPAKPPQPAIEEEPYGRCTNMRMSSFAVEPQRSSNSATLPLQRTSNEQRFDYSHCNTMPLPIGCHNQQQTQLQQQQNNANNITYSTPSVTSFKTPNIMYANSAVAMAGANAAKLQQQLQQQFQLQQQQAQLQMHTTLPNGVRYSNPHFLRRLPHITKAAESPYGHLGLGAGHHTFSKLLQDPLQSNSLVNTSIPEDRDSANYSMTSDQDCALYATAAQIN